MGCAQSKADNEESASVSRCKERRNLMREVATARNCFASRHSGYCMDLKSLGAALNDFAGGEFAPPPLDTVAVQSEIPKINQVGSEAVNGVDLLRSFSEIDDHFLKAYQSSLPVSKMLEGSRLDNHYDSAGNRGHVDHGDRVMELITWNKSFRKFPLKDEFDPNDYKMHAAVLDKLLASVLDNLVAWEKRLYEEIKAGERVNRDYQRRVGALDKLRKRNASAKRVGKAEAAVKRLHARCGVDMQSLASTISEINGIRDNQLYPKLVALVHGMSKMWESMCMHHSCQLKIATDLNSLEVSGVLVETSQNHHDRTIRLLYALEWWSSEFEGLVSYQRVYITALTNWLKLNLMPIESSFNAKASSSPSAPLIPPIQPLVQAWGDNLETLSCEALKGTIVSFVAAIKTIFLSQEEEMELKKKCVKTGREYICKKQAFEDWYQESMKPHEGGSSEVEVSGKKDTVSERQFVVESLKKQREEEMEEYRKYCVQSREKSFEGLKIQLLETFRALSDFSHTCFQGYERLRLLIESLLPSEGW